MFVLMMIIAGMAVSLAIYFLLSGIFASEPALDIHTVQDLGLAVSVFTFAVCGPVLVLKLWFAGDEDDHDRWDDTLALITNGAIAFAWSGILGFAATQAALLLEPSLLTA